MEKSGVLEGTRGKESHNTEGREHEISPQAKIKKGGAGGGTVKIREEKK